MDIQKEREAFEVFFKATPYYTGHNCTPKYTTYRSMFAAWQAAKSQGVPEGFVLVPKEPTQEMHQAGQDMVTFGGGYDDIYGAMIEAQVPNQTTQFNLDEFLSMEQKLKHKGGVITADLDRFIAYAEMVLEKAKALKEPK